MSGLVSARVPAGGNAWFAFEPRAGSREVALVCSPEEYSAVIGRGFAFLDGIRGVPVLDACNPAVGFLRLRLDEPWQRPTLEAVAA